MKFPNKDEANKQITYVLEVFFMAKFCSFMCFVFFCLPYTLGKYSLYLILISYLERQSYFTDNDENSIRAINKDDVYSEDERYALPSFLNRRRGKS